MCRIAGILHHNRIDKVAERIHAMTETLAHGGPDAQGSYVDDYIALGHRRLSIIDVSAAGNQPMYWQQYVMVFNGEIYNYRALRAELETQGAVFETGSDTEVLLRGWSVWGHQVLEKCRGMFAFAIWDKQKRSLTLCRDRVGVKPLYYYRKNGIFCFASELKAFYPYGDFDKTIDPEAVALYLRQGYIQAPYSIYRHVRKVKPGCLLEIDAAGALHETVYWRASDALYQSEAWRESEPELTDRLEHLLRESFQLRMVADVPVGIFLSGGIDSSLVAALLQSEASGRLNTFTIGFEDQRYNEARQAKAIAQYLGTDHTELYCTIQEAADIVPLLPDLYDEPFGDSSGIPTHAVARLAKQQVKVSLSADGGDELFGGYVKYQAATRFYQRLQGVPRPLRRAGKHLLDHVDPKWLEKMPFFRAYKELGPKFTKFRHALDAPDLVSFFDAASCFLTVEAQRRFIEVAPVRYAALEGGGIPPFQRKISMLGLLDIQTYLEGDILTKVDRATMRTALEGREPFLDHHLIEFAMKLPDHYKIRNRTSKYLLRQILYRHIPRELIDRPKQGFAVPVAQWLRTLYAGELRDMATDTAFCEALSLNPVPVRMHVAQFLAGDHRVSPSVIWFLFTLRQWYKRWLA